MWYQKSWERVPNGILNVPCVLRAFRWTIHATKSTVELGFPFAQANWITPKTTSPSFLVRPHQPHLHRFDWAWQPHLHRFSAKNRPTAEVEPRPCRFTPWKINMEPTNHSFRKENDLKQTSRELWSMSIFRGVCVTAAVCVLVLRTGGAGPPEALSDCRGCPRIRRFQNRRLINLENGKLPRYLKKMEVYHLSEN